MANSSPEAPSNPTIAAADFFSSCARRLLNVDGAIHAETLIASLARMSGSLMYRTFGIDASIKPGTVVLSDQANTQGPKLVEVVIATLGQLGDAFGKDDLDKQYMSETHSKLTVLESLDRLGPPFLDYCAAHSLPLQDGAVAAAIATALCIHDCRQVLAANKGVPIAIFGLIEGTKTAPPVADSPANAISAAAPKPKKPWYQFW